MVISIMAVMKIQVVSIIASVRSSCCARYAHPSLDYYYCQLVSCHRYYQHDYLSCAAGSCMVTILVSKSNCASQE